MAVRRAAREHEVMDNRALDAVPNEGYRVVEAAAHMELAQRHQRKGQRSTLRALSKVEHVDLTGLDVAARRAFEVVAIAFKLQADINRKLDIRQKTLERQVSAAMSAQDRTSDEVADLRARLEKLEAEREPGA